MKRFLKVVTIVFVVFSLVCLVACQTNDNTQFLEQSVQNARLFLDSNKCAYVSISFEFSNDFTFQNETMHCYSLVVEMSLENATNYPYILEILTLLDGNYAAKDVENFDSYFTCEYVLCNGVRYQVGWRDYLLENASTHKDVYNSVAAKNGVELTLTDKAHVYDQVKYYMEKTDGEAYKYTIDQAYQKAASEFNLSAEQVAAIWADYDVYVKWTEVYNKR